MFRTGGGDVKAALPPSFATPGYHHLAATYDAGAVTIYADGALLGSGNLPDIGPISLSSALRFGDDAFPLDGGDEQFVGHADDIVIWDTVLSASQISSLYVNGAIIPEPGTLVLLGFGLIGLVAYTWRKRR